jgi:hypothetical protein
MNMIHPVDRRIETVLNILQGKMTEQEAAIASGVSVEEIQDWKVFYATSVRCSMNQDKSFRTRMTGRGRVRAAAIIGVLLVLSVTAAIAAPTEILQCTEGNNFFCFSPSTPAKSSEVNHNFAKMGEWMQNTVGPIDDLIVDSTVAGVTSINGALTADSADFSGPLTASAMTVAGALAADSAVFSSSLNALAVTVNGDLNATEGTTNLGALNAGVTELGALTATSLNVTDGLPIIKSIEYTSGTMTPITSSVCFLTHIHIRHEGVLVDEGTCHITSNTTNWVLESSAGSGNTVDCGATCISW